MKRLLILVIITVALMVSCSLMLKDGLIPQPTHIARDTDQPPLKILARKRGIEIGTAVVFGPIRNDPMYRKTLVEEFDILMPENGMKFENLQPQRGRYDFTLADEFVKFAQENGLEVLGHTLLWERGLPSWLRGGNFSRDELIEILRDHIQTVAGHYQGQIEAWDTVNESLGSDGSLKDTIWLHGIGPEYIDLAFKWAHEADPHAKLYYNEYATYNFNSIKTQRLYQLIKGLKERGVPIDGVGLQMHIGLPGPDPAEVAEVLQKLGELGLEVQLSEVDVGIRDGKGTREERLAKQAEVYRGMLAACLSVPNCQRFVTWGFTDRYSWAKYQTQDFEAPLIFDDAYRPKPAYYALVEELAQGQ